MQYILPYTKQEYVLSRGRVFILTPVEEDTKLMIVKFTNSYHLKMECIVISTPFINLFYTATSILQFFSFLTREKAKRLVVRMFVKQLLTRFNGQDSGRCLAFVARFFERETIFLTEQSGKRWMCTE